MLTLTSGPSHVVFVAWSGFVCMYVCVQVMYSCILAYLIIFCWKLDILSSIAILDIVCPSSRDRFYFCLLCINLVTWLVCFNDVCVPWSVEVWWLLLRDCSPGHGYSHPDNYLGMTVALARLLFTMSFPDFSVNHLPCVVSHQMLSSSNCQLNELFFQQCYEL